MGRASTTKLHHLLWNTNLVEIELSSLCLPPGCYIEPLLQCQKTTLVQRSAFAETTCSSVPEAVTTAKWRDVLEREQFSSRIVAISVGEAHSVSKW